eukprot:Opistho-2@24974
MALRRPRLAGSHTAIGNESRSQTSNCAAPTQPTGSWTSRVPRMAQQQLPFMCELQQPGTTHHELAVDGLLQLIQLHAHRRLRTMDLERGAGQRAGVDRGNKAPPSGPASPAGAPMYSALI